MSKISTLFLSVSPLTFFFKLFPIQNPEDTPSFSREKAFAFHLVASLLVALFVFGVMFLLWYRPPFFHALEGKTILLLILGVDVCLGPLLTLIIFNPKKKRKILAKDILVIGFLQICALTYGLHILFASRPVFVVYSYGSFDLVTANSLDPKDLAKTVDPAFQSLSLTGPLYVYTERPTNLKDRNEVVWGGMSGKDLFQFPQYYVPFSENQMKAAKAAHPLAELRKINPGISKDLDMAIRHSGRQEQQIGFVPLRAKIRTNDETVLIGKEDGKILGFLVADPWPDDAHQIEEKKQPPQNTQEKQPK